jgi:hypothetical protein
VQLKQSIYSDFFLLQSIALGYFTGPVILGDFEIIPIEAVKDQIFGGWEWRSEGEAPF